VPTALVADASRMKVSGERHEGISDACQLALAAAFATVGKVKGSMAESVPNAFSIVEQRHPVGAI
jgi:hypothetical protein